jgi:hypothetical protein
MNYSNRSTHDINKRSASVTATFLLLTGIALMAFIGTAIAREACRGKHTGCDLGPDTCATTGHVCQANSGHYTGDTPIDCQTQADSYPTDPQCGQYLERPTPTTNRVNGTNVVMASTNCTQPVPQGFCGHTADSSDCDEQGVH